MRADLDDFPGVQHKIEVDDHRAAGKGARELRLQDGLFMLGSDFQRRDGMVVFSLGFCFPGFNGGQSLIGAAFIAHRGVGREACRQRFGIACVFKLYIQSNGGWELDGHSVSFCHCLGEKIALCLRNDKNARKGKVLTQR